MDFNMGWLVQAEAPPGMLFRQFKSAIRAGEVDPRDVAFYFTHWLTDLAGAEPTPLDGCEKFVLRFPQRVLTAFLRSIPFVQRLHAKSETATFEDYLRWRWQSVETLGPMGQGAGTAAQLRLVTMAQKAESRVLEAYWNLALHDKRVLDVELALSGCEKQVFTDDADTVGGPAFLVYYAPALLQRHAALCPGGALVALAEVFRQARDLWPLSMDATHCTVTVRVDVLKDLELEELYRPPFGTGWVLERVTDVDGVVKKVSLADVARSGQRVLFFGCDRTLCS